MARPPKNHEAAAALGERLTELHDQHDSPTPKAIELWIHGRYGTHVSDESIRKAHRGEIDPNACSMELLAGVAAYYGVALPDLTPAVAQRVLTLIEMAGLPADFTPLELGLAMSRWTLPRQSTLDELLAQLGVDDLAPAA